MKKVYKYSLLLVAVVVIVALCAVAYIKLALPAVPLLTDIKVDASIARVERGRYLAHHVAVCMDCHSTRDWSRFSGPMLQEKPGGGGQRFGKEMGFPGTFYAPNITPCALKDWSDAELFRAITSGVSRDGSAMLPLMPYPNYGKMDKEDIYDIIAYIRTLAPVENKVPSSEPDFPVSILINTMPAKAALTQKPFANNVVARGKYLVNMAGCADCHSKVDKGVIVAGTEFGGGREFIQPAGIVRSPNISPDPETGIGHMSMSAFVARFRQYSDTAYKLAQLGPGDLNSPMPWTMYAGMTHEDLECIYHYLSSISAITGKVKVYERHTR